MNIRKPGPQLTDSAVERLERSWFGATLSRGTNFGTDAPQQLPLPRTLPDNVKDVELNGAGGRHEGKTWGKPEVGLPKGVTKSGTRSGSGIADDPTKQVASTDNSVPPASTGRSSDTVQACWRVVWILTATIVLAPLAKPALMAAEAPSDAQLIRVVDGDTLELRIAGSAPTMVGIGDIDAPKPLQKGGKAARDELFAMVSQGNVAFHFVRGAHDLRTVHVIADGVDVSRAMVLRGLARPCAALMRDPMIFVLDHVARIWRTGTWERDGSFEPPWTSAETRCRPRSPVALGDLQSWLAGKDSSSNTVALAGRANSGSGG